MSCAYPGVMLEYLDGRINERKFWLFACACCRLLWHRFSDWRIRRVVESAELFADGRDAGEHLAAARAAVNVASRGGVGQFAHLLDETRSGYSAALGCIDGVYCLSAGIPIRRNIRHFFGCFGAEGFEPLLEKLMSLLRDIAGNPFRPVSIDPIWRAANEGAALSIAQKIYEDREFERMPVLGDALEDAGCSNEEILSHCRGPGPHARGCWVVDALLDRPTGPTGR